MTLVELMVAMTIVALMVVTVGAVYARTSRVAMASLSLIHLYQQREALNRVLESDLVAMAQTTAFQIDPANGGFTFMRSRRRDPTQDGSYFTLDPWKGSDLEWVVWRWDHAKGELLRGQTRKPILGLANQVLDGGIRNQGAWRNGQHPTAQQHFLYLIGKGPTIAGTAFTGAPGTRQQIFESHPWTAIGSEPESRAFLGEDPLPAMRTVGMLGSSIPVPDVYAVRNPDGVSYNKDWANLVGAVGSTAYPAQISTLAEGCEYFSVELLHRDGSEVSVATEDDTLGDGPATIDVSGLDLNGRYQPDWRRRPTRAIISYLLHDVPTRSPQGTPPIEALRQAIQTRADLADPDPVIETRNRRNALLDLINRGRHRAILVVKSVRIDS